jgi:hypothetical protein
MSSFLEGARKLFIILNILLLKLRAFELAKLGLPKKESS